MDALRKVMSEFNDFDSSLDVDARKVDTIHKIGILENLGPDIQKEFKGRALPLEIYSFALKSMISPHFQTRFTPQILDLLAMIEFYRLFISSKMTALLVFDEFYVAGADATVQNLSDEDRDFFVQFGAEDPSMRTLFLKIVALCCRVDVCQKWLQKSNTDFWILWNQYFSFLEEDPQNTNTPALKFQHDLNPEERKIFQQAAHLCVKYMNVTFTSAEDQRQEDQSIRELMETSDFAVQHPLQNLDDFSGRIIAYADRVSEAWNRVRTANTYDVRLDLPRDEVHIT